jgi:hypothetical protein
VVTSPIGLETKNHSAAINQQQFNSHAASQVHSLVGEEGFHQDKLIVSKPAAIKQFRLWLLERSECEVVVMVTIWWRSTENSMLKAYL